MKNTLIRAFVVMTLASSLQAFAQSEKGKDRTKNCTCACDTSSPAPAQNDKYTNQSQQQTDNDPAQARKQLIEEQNRQWLHDLQGIYGG